MSSEDKIDRFMRHYLLENLSKNASAECLAHEELVSYLRGELSGVDNDRVERHLSACLLCLNEINSVIEIIQVEQAPDEPGIELINKLKASLENVPTEGQGPTVTCKNCTRTVARGLSYCPHCGNRILLRKNVLYYLNKNKWLLASITAFVMSFIVKRYFLQFLALAVVLGIKWALDPMRAKTLIMVYDAWKSKREHKKDSADNSRISRHIER